MVPEAGLTQSILVMLFGALPRRRFTPPDGFAAGRTGMPLLADH